MTSPEQTIDDVLPDPGFDIEPRITALGVTDPQHDFLSADGVAQPPRCTVPGGW